MVYAINNRESYEHLDIWLKEIKRESNPDAKIFNKCDLEKERVVTYEEANIYSEDKEFSKFFEASAKEGINAKEICIEAARMLYEDYTEYKSKKSSSVTEKTNPKLKIALNKNEHKSICC